MTEGDLLVLMYHRARAGGFGNAPDVLDAHFRHLAATCRNVMPGEPLDRERLNVCVSFDDAYFDFYSIVYPLLRKHGLRALLAVPAAYIREAVTTSVESRQAIDCDDAFARPAAGGFCTWAEIRGMVHSGNIAVAAHGFSHTRLDRHDVDLDTEVDAVQSILREAVGAPVTSFVFPFGRWSPAALRRARSRYTHVFRIGGALNRGWSDRVLYRVDADVMPSPTALLEPRQIRRYRIRRWWNRLRRR